MARPDYCPVGNEPCQSMCDEPCSWQGSKRKKEDDALIQQLVEALFTAAQAAQKTPHQAARRSTGFTAAQAAQKMAREAMAGIGKRNK